MQDGVEPGDSPAMAEPSLRNRQFHPYGRHHCMSIGPILPQVKLDDEYHPNNQYLTPYGHNSPR